MEKSACKKTCALLVLRIALSIACAVMLAFIFSNSLKSGEQSSEQSAQVVAFVQDVAAVIAPWSGIAEATGEDYERVHSAVRSLAHFSEFALLGALFCWCTLSYTRKKRYQLLPLSGVIITPLIDESLQFFSDGRAADWTDIFVDTAGGICGMAFALACLALGVCAYKYYQKKRENNVAGKLGNRAS